MIPDVEKLDIAIEIVGDFWPEVISFLNEDATPHHGIAWTYGLCTHPGLAKECWVHSQGGKDFVMDQTLPNSFLWVGIQEKVMSEAFFLVMFRNGRRFWFYDQYFESLWFSSEYGGWYEGGLVQEYEVRGATWNLRSRCRLGLALNRWTSNNEDVIYSGDWGWLDPTSRTFQMDRGSSHKEQQQLCAYTRRSSPYGEFVQRVYARFEADANEFGPTFATLAKGRGDGPANR